MEKNKGQICLLFLKEFRFLPVNKKAARQSADSPGKPAF
jgi:hypothetical protein